MRLIFAVGVALLLPAWIARNGHMLLVSHAVCAAHGELVHDGHEASEERHESSSSQDVSAASHHGDSHEHCHALATDVVVSAPPLVLDADVLPWIAIDAPAGRIVVTSRQTLLLRAPKTSPPA
ncbi:MAG TPA: hypothetical protein VFB62_03325 [Polyangiaceae bacterium]|nr:hypothetical protein [Polyangiaceae bacterium]